MPVPLWFQKEISITAPSRGCHLITNDILKAVGDDLRQINVGLCNLFVQHTSASLTINENADPDVRRDMEVALNKLVPAQWCRDGTFRHVRFLPTKKSGYLVNVVFVRDNNFSHTAIMSMFL